MRPLPAIAGCGSVCSTAPNVRAQELAQRLPKPVGVERTELGTACTPAELAGLTGVLFMYQRFIADVTISIVHVTDASTPAAASQAHFPVAVRVREQPPGAPPSAPSDVSAHAHPPRERPRCHG